MSGRACDDLSYSPGRYRKPFAKASFNLSIKLGHNLTVIVSVACVYSSVLSSQRLHRLKLPLQLITAMGIEAGR